MRLTHLLLLVCLTAALGSCAGSRSLSKSNRSDHKGLAKGKWRTYQDSATQLLFTSGRYRHGRPVGTFRYYAPSGTLDRTESYAREGLCEVLNWYPNGKVARRGQAQWVTGKGQAPRFFWYGPWTSYAEDGQVTSVDTYTDGTITRSEQYKNGKLTRVETYEPGNVTRTEIYRDGELLKVETYEKGQRTQLLNVL